VKNLFFWDEATFNNREQVNRHNCHYYSNVNPHRQRNQKFQIQWSNVWVGIVGDHIIDPYFFEENLNAANYLHFLQNDLPDLLRPVGNQVFRIMWFQQDGASAHKARIIKTYLSKRFPNRWISISSEIHEFSPRSDLTLLEFFLWGYIKDIVYAEEPNQRPRRHQKPHSRSVHEYYSSCTLQCQNEHSTVISSVVSNKTDRAFKHLIP